MAKALVIKNANFSANKVAKITFEENIPCTGISFASGTITVTGFSPVEIDYTVTPVDTTDEIIWTSSNTSVATVSDGVLTAVGLGSCTITATCGSHTATATVTVQINVTPEFTWGYTNVVSNHAYFVGNNSRFICSGDGSLASQYYVWNDADHTDVIYPCLIPNGASKIRVSRTGTGTNTLFYNTNSNMVWFKNESCGDNDAPDAAKYVGVSSEAVNLCTTASGTFSVPEGVNAFMIVIRCGTSYSDTPASTVAANMGLTLEYLAD